MDDRTRRHIRLRKDHHILRRRKGFPSVGRSENFITEKIKGCLRRKMVAFDIGANRGMHTHSMECQCDRVYAFEPHIENVKYLEEKFLYKRNVRIIPKAVQNHTGPTKLYTHQENHGGHTTRIMSAESRKWGHCLGRYHEIESIKIDDFVEQEQFERVDLIKIDVEGDEVEVLKSGEKTFEKFHPMILLETHIGVDLKWVYDFFVKLGYTCFDTEDNTVLELKEDHTYRISLL